MNYRYYVLILLCSIALIVGSSIPAVGATDEQLAAFERKIVDLTQQVERLKMQNDIFQAEISSFTIRADMLEMMFESNYRVLSSELKSSTAKGNTAGGTDVLKDKGIMETVTVDGKKQQYVHIQSKDKDNEIDILVDPQYVDMSIEMPNKNVKPTQQQQKPQQDNKSAEERAKEADEYLSKQMDNKSSGGKPISKDVLKDLHETQKLFYSKKYYDALKTVQRSLMTQETSLGYALQGSIFYTLGDTEAAVNSWESALKLDPEMEEVKRALLRYGKRR
ncbi:MAG: hypothetical protein WC955_05285 [Elusimicrobiota bacterium]